MYRYGSNDTPKADHAVWGDFCEAFVKDMKPLYLLAFLLTANHQDAEQCFEKALEAASEAMVFRDWVRFWIRRTLIKDAIPKVLRRPGDSDQTRDSWGESGAATPFFDAVVRLGSLERLVFVIVVLERHSVKECSLLLDCSERAVITARLHALKNLSSDRAPGISLAPNRDKLQICRRPRGVIPGRARLLAGSIRGGDE